MDSHSTPADTPAYKPQMGYVPSSQSDRSEEIARAALARFDVMALAIAAGTVFALGLMAATLVLVAKGAPEGMQVGPHLALLANFLPGYSVSWIGGLLALLYGFVIGAALGALVGVVWNVANHIIVSIFFARGGAVSQL